MRKNNHFSEVEHATYQSLIAGGGSASHDFLRYNRPIVIGRDNKARDGMTKGESQFEHEVSVGVGTDD